MWRMTLMKYSLSLAAIAAVVAGPAMAQDNVLHIYNWSDYIAEDTVAKFTAATGIEVTYDVFDSNEVLEAKMLAGNSGYDLVIPTSNFLARQIVAGVYQPLDKSKLPNIVNMDPALMEAASAYDENNEHAVIYLWGTTGIGYNVAKIKERLGDDYVVDSWDLVLNPEIAAKLADCGINWLDGPVEVLPAVLNWLGLDPMSREPADFEKAAEAMAAVRPSINDFHSSKYIIELANGDICVAVGWSGDVFIAQARAGEAQQALAEQASSSAIEAAKEAGKSEEEAKAAGEEAAAAVVGQEIEYVIPKEGAQQWFDMMAIPVDAPNPDAAHRFINFVMDPQITADITNYVWYANANTPSLALVDPEIIANPGIFPTAEASEKMWVAQTYDSKIDRVITRLWTRITTGQ